MEIPIPDPPLAEGVVALRPWRLEDAPVLAKAWADPAIRRWCSVPEDATVDGADRWISGSDRSSGPIAGPRSASGSMPTIVATTWRPRR